MENSTKGHPGGMKSTGGSASAHSTDSRNKGSHGGQCS